MTNESLAVAMEYVYSSMAGARETSPGEIVHPMGTCTSNQTNAHRKEKKKGGKEKNVVR